MITGEKIKSVNGKLSVPDFPVIPYIMGDGTGPDIWKAAVRIFDAAVDKAFCGKKKIIWKEVLAGSKAFEQSGSWMPAETLDIFREYLVGIKGPLTTPVGEGIRSLNVKLRQELKKVHAKNSERHDLNVAPEDGTLYAVMVKTMDIALQEDFPLLAVSDGSSL